MAHERTALLAEKRQQRKNRSPIGRSRVLFLCSIFLCTCIGFSVVVPWLAPTELEYQLYGAVVSLGFNMALVVSYHSTVVFRMHPNPLIYYKSGIDFLLAGSVLMGWSQLGRILHSMSECWFCIMSVDLYRSINNPFTDFKQDLKWYQFVSLLVGLGIGTLPGISSQLYAVAAMTIATFYRFVRRGTP